MEDRMYKVFSPNDSKVAMKVIPGHFCHHTFSYYTLCGYDDVACKTE